MKKLLSIILTILMLATSIPFALAADTVASGTCGADGDNLTWILDTDGTLTISGTGAMAEYSNVHLPMYDDYLPPWADYKESIKKIVIEEGVTELGRYAFYEHPAVKHISIADSVTNLVGRVFDGCSAVESLIIPAGVSTLDSTSFQDCSSLKKIVFLGKVDLEGYYAFDGCPELREIVFAKGATNNTTIEMPFNTETINVSETVIHFGGTQAEAEAAFTPIDETRDVFFALATIHYIDGCNCSVCGEYHIYDNGICVLCGYECSHESYTDGKCDVCAYECPHENCTDYICDDCGEECPHKAFTDFICDNCGYECSHESYTDGKCNVCAYECPHESYTDYICDNCGEECPHEKVTDGICDACAAEVNIITITMSDSFGDGWDGNSIIIERLVDGAYTEAGTATIEAGASETFTIVLSKDGIFAFSWLEGNYPEECSFTVAVDGETVYECTDGSTLNGGKVFYSTCEHTFNTDGKCNVCGYECVHENYTDGECPDCGFKGMFIEITMKDSYGDGWNGNKLLIKNTSGEEIGVATFDEGYDDTYTILLAEDVIFTLTWQEGSYSEECSFEVSVDGETVFESEYGDAYEDGEVVYTYCDHEFVNSVCTKCGNPCLHDTDNGECSLCGKYLYAIMHQPTEAEPYVELNDDTDATYQWYKVEGLREITDENADTVSYDWGDSSYDAETGWTGVRYDENSNEQDFFTVALNAGDTVIIELTGDFYDWVGLYDYSTEEDFGEEVESGVNTYEITVTADGNYTFYTYVNSGVVTVKAYLDDLVCSAIEGETGAALSNPAYGNRYLCEVTFADGTTEQSDVLDFSYRITHQPTEAEPYVELNDDTDAFYQWYVFERKTVEITDENATALTPEFLGMPEDMFTQVASYDAENGWQSSVLPQESGNGLLFFIADLKAGDVVNVTFSAAPDDSKLLTIDADKIADAETEDGINYSFTVLEDGLYGLQALCNDLLYVSANMEGTAISAPEGETDARLQSMEYGKKYFCEVTFADGTTEESDILDLTYRITHQPTAGEPYVELNGDTDATYQWHEIEYGTIEITDENATAMDGSIRDAEYVPGEGWHIGLESEYEDGTYIIYVFERDFEAGDQIILDVTTTETDPVLWLGGSGDFNYVGFTPDENGRLCATIEQDDTYGLFSGNVYDTDMIIKAYLYSRNTPVELEGETDARLQNPEFGAAYYCAVTFADGTSEVSDSFEYKYAITHQPTEEEPYVELNDNTDASYQWNTVEEGIVEITDEEATGDWSSLGAPSELHGEYDPQTGWTSTEGYYFVIELQEGETVELEASESVSEWWIAYAENPGMYTDYWTVEQYGTTISFTATADGYYGFAISNDFGVAVRAYMDGSVYTAIDGQTTDTLTPDTIGQYACEVTFADGTTEMSDVFEVTSVHTCDFSGEWKNDAEKHWKECDCGLISEESGHTWKFGECTECSYACEHSFTKYTATKAPTCTEAGMEMAPCDLGCDAVNSREIPATNHKDSLVQVEAQAPTCTEIGWDAYEYCTACDYTTYKEIPVAAHTEETVKGYAATCEKAGLTDGVKCAICGAVITAQQTIDKLTHKDDNGDYKCDHGCGHEFEKPVEPDTPDEPADGDCDHLCHKSGIMSIFWKIIRFFYRLFNIQQYCDCGVIHYDAPVFG
ncbi:MAG: leucine-rich repeat domain-containing protein [Clostridia bacterium]|nr:leucine-rich repeat domain-containing protein [Clostridia bacterium]